MSKQRIAIYPGSFNPFTVGHLNVLEQAEKLFDKVYIAVGVNPDKLSEDVGKIYPSLDPRVLTIQRNFPNKNVIGYTGFLVDLITKREQEHGEDITIVKGIRNGVDLDYEMIQHRYNQDLKPNVKVVFLPADRELMHVSSSGYRMLEKIRPGAGHKYLAKDLGEEKSE